MATDTIQAQYDQLDDIAGRFVAQADATTEMQQRLQQRFIALQTQWIGEGSAAFMGEMEADILPAVQRMTSALEEGDAVTRQIIEVLRAAEDEAAQAFSVGDGTLISGGAGAAAASTGGASAGNGAAAPQKSSDLEVRDANEAFTPANMQALIGSQYAGEDSQKLNSAMEGLWSGKDVSGNLDTIAEMRNIPREQVQQDYEKYLQLRDLADKQGALNGKDPISGVNTFFHGDFLGSTASLRYGEVVGNTFGIDPVFGSLLNPTGGLIGPGNWSVEPADDNAIGYHGIVHDAAGYLNNYHDMGPGYDYLGQEGGDTGSPLTGQQSGITWWIQQDNTDIPFVPDVLVDTSIEIVEDVSGVITGVSDGFSDLFEGDLGGFADGMGDALENAAEIPVDIVVGIGTGIGDAVESIGDFFGF